MKLSAPIHQLKRQAKQLSREQQIPLSQALNTIANQNGFAQWSHLISIYDQQSLPEKMFDQLCQPRLTLVGARPGHGKTKFAFGLAVEATKRQRQSWIFSLEYTQAQVEERFAAEGGDAALVNIDVSDQISSEYIATQLADVKPDSVVVVDCLQLLDQVREKPVLAKQVEELEITAKQCGISIILITQIDRSFDDNNQHMPTISDLRLPNQIDIEKFDRIAFIHNQRVQLINPNTADV